MLIKTLAADIHQNAKAHGWWEGNRSFAETIALIHSEWSEALEEARAGRPMVYRICHEDPEEKAICNPQNKEDCLNYGKERECKYYGKKPEGIAVELIDGCIRILDYLGRTGYFDVAETLDKSRIGLTAEKYYRRPDTIPPDPLPELIGDLHAITSDAYRKGSEHLEMACKIAMRWVDRQGIDPVKLILEKHEFNKGRPYKHGKEF